MRVSSKTIQHNLSVAHTRFKPTDAEPPALAPSPSPSPAPAPAPAPAPDSAPTAGSTDDVLCGLDIMLVFC
jgi:hypothetical protein